SAPRARPPSPPRSTPRVASRRCWSSEGALVSRRGCAAPQPAEKGLRLVRVTEADAPTLRPRRARLSRRTRILLIVGVAVALVLALVAGLLIATSLAQQAAADERRAAARAVTEARSALDDAARRIDTAAGSLDEAITAADAGLAVAGPGLDDAARPALQGARDDAAEVREAEGEADGMYGDEVVAQPDDDSATASALRRQAELY